MQHSHSLDRFADLFTADGKLELSMLGPGGVKQGREELKSKLMMMMIVDEY